MGHANRLLIWYNDCDIYNADETALFYKFLSEITLAFKRETCHGIIHGIIHDHSIKDSQWCYAQVRVVLKKEYVLLVIGKYTRLRCFNNLKKLPVLYHSNTKVWMKMIFLQNSFMAMIDLSKKVEEFRKRKSFYLLTFLQLINLIHCLWKIRKSVFPQLIAYRSYKSLIPGKSNVISNFIGGV